MFSEQAQDRAAPGSAIHPQHQGICLGIAGWLYKPDNYTCSVKAKAWKGQDASLRIWQVKKSGHKGTWSIHFSFEMTQ